jgi:hypothetical protein
MLDRLKTYVCLFFQNYVHMSETFSGYVLRLGWTCFKSQLSLGCAKACPIGMRESVSVWDARKRVLLGWLCESVSCYDARKGGHSKKHPFAHLCAKACRLVTRESVSC